MGGVASRVLLQKGKGWIPNEKIGVAVPGPKQGRKGKPGICQPEGRRGTWDKIKESLVNLHERIMAKDG